MGMAASQARLLGLQARKSNLEYQAQQINQERSVLSQQCTAMYNSLLAMNVPTPPSTGDYTKLEYSGVDGATNFSIGTVKPGQNGTYVVELKTQANTDALSRDYQTQKVGKDATTGNYTVNGQLAYKLSDILDEDGRLKNGVELPEGVDEAFANVDWSRYLDAIVNSNDDINSRVDALDNFYVYFQQNGTDAEGNPLLNIKFVNSTQFESAIQSENHYAEVYSYDDQGQIIKNDIKEGCLLTFDSLGMITEIKIPTDDGKYSTIKLTATKITDSAAYEDAMNQYEYAQYEYDRKQEEINAKTEIIQQQDRNLELKLQRLDTERQQIEAEYEAIEKVIKDNIDKSFKTFSG